MPTLGAVMIIVFGMSNTLVGRLLSIRPLRWIGLISYSAYLWHQPFLVFIRLRSNDVLNPLFLIIVVIILFFISSVSYLFIEQPFRDKKRFTCKKIFIAATVAAAVTLVVAVFLIQTADNRSLVTTPAGDPYLSDLRKHGNSQYVVRAFNALAKQKRTFSNQTSKTNKRLTLIGDSFAQDFYNMIIEGKHLTNYEICVYFIYSRCQIYFGTEDRTRFVETKHRQACTNAYDITYALPIIRQADIIILSSNWYEWSAQRLPVTLKLLNLTKNQQIFVVGPKHFGHVNPMLYVNKSMEYRLKQYQYPKQEVLAVNNLLEKTIDKSIYVNLQKMICNAYNHSCPLFTRDGKLISHDGAHLTKYGARYVGNIIFKNQPLNKL